MRRSLCLVSTVVLCAVGGIASSTGTAAATASVRTSGPVLASAAGGADVTNLVVIYQENHSFDNLFGTWGTVGAALSSATARPCAASRARRRSRALGRSAAFLAKARSSSCARVRGNSGTRFVRGRG